MYLQRHLPPLLAKLYERLRFDNMFKGTYLEGEYKYVYLVCDRYTPDTHETLLQYMRDRAYDVSELVPLGLHALIATCIHYEPDIADTVYENATIKYPGVSLAQIRQYVHYFDPEQPKYLNIVTGTTCTKPPENMNVYPGLISPLLVILRYLVDTLFASRRLEVYQDLLSLDTPQENLLFEYYLVDTHHYAWPSFKPVEGKHVSTQLPPLATEHDPVYLRHLQALYLTPGLRVTETTRVRLCRGDKGIYLVTQEDLQKLRDLEAHRYYGPNPKIKGPISLTRGNIWRNAYEVDNVCPMDAKCFCCNRATISVENFEAGHITAAARGGRGCVGNIRPVCRNCNTSMDVCHMGAYMYAFSYTDGPGWLDPAMHGYTEEQLTEATRVYEETINKL